MTESQSSLLTLGIAQLGLVGPPGLESGVEQSGVLSRYIAELELWNPKLRLVDAAEDDLITRHILDCLAAVDPVRACISDSPKIADLGSGAGLPGLLFALYLPQARVDLVERSGRRCGFLRNCRAVLSLSNVTVRECEYAQLSPSSYDLVTSRAFSEVDTRFLSVLDRVLTESGCALLLKGRRERVERELQVIETCGGFEARATALTVPLLDAERTILEIRRPA